MRQTMPSSPRPLLVDWQWQDQAACRGMSSSVFFSPSGERGRARRDREEQARRICAGCAVTDRCAATALAHEESYGVWGGLSGKDRRRLGTDPADADQGVHSS
ncbi:WhiB family transcriptional regulator [Streptomyces sp. cg28]|uniref:WhiB family transcriptional regulator n=1 Tax=unclassified Streptomyces TaxID=2593676 RepID=UPI000DC35FE4|nr:MULTISPECIES: WhiB family transcriptional regulator [unclassified Streptomyces]RAJ82562.1 WhiB family redox-sensing transcriptional regulator [Streptomyces sp. PsTaAH-137]